MNDKSNILAGLIGRPSSGGPSGRQVDQQGSNKENSQQQVSTPSNSRPTSVLSQRPQSSGSGRQHKLKQRFTVIRKLGKGTYGKVQLAINKETGQEVAIKTIKKTKIENEHDLQRVRREIQIMSSIEHPHIIHIYEVFENKDKIVLVMQYAPGGELYEYVSQSKVLEESEARRLFRQVATAVYYCHENKICHRDLKLENILLDEKNNAKLADFGLSNVFDKRRHLLNTFCGSPLYASPEIVRGSPYEGPEVDCWSLGVILYTLVYGAMPFDGSNFKLLVKQIIGASYFEPKQKSQASALIRRLLCVDPAQRATIADICSDPWVNGSVSSPCRSLLEASAGQHHHSLLKVAQDMANLTPVRLDILLALAPVSPPPRPPPPTLGEKRTIAPMEVDDEKKQFELHDSPVASYVVRDLEPPISTVMAPKSDEQPMMELAIEQTKPEDQSLMEPEEETMLVELMVEGAREEAKVDVIQEDQDDKIQPTASKEANNVAMDLDKPVDTQGIDLSRDQSLGELHSNKLDRKSVDKESSPLTDNQETGGNPIESESVAGAQEVEEIVEGEIVKMEEAINEEQTELIDKTEEETCPATDMPTVEQNKENQEIPIESAGEVEKVVDGGTVGEKKKKKKVIVVKKKKKKTTGEVDGEKAKKEDPASEQAKVSPESPAPKKPTTKASKAPGKVRIPDTFTEPQPEGPPPKVNLETRRQSALITDVSQKLLQQQPQIPSSSISPSEQVQLASVRVSDKKNDFERRASLMVEETLARSSKPNSPQPYDRLNSATDMEEPKSIEALIESIKLLADIEQTIAESPQTAAIGPLDTASPQPIPVEGSSTPTIADELTMAHRSNSDETIKDEDRAVTNKNKRSTLTLDLGEGSQQVASELPLRPAPIARSYKKVTFTKDGACITETGKIYAHQAEDGSVHRVKRKSKVTHYPADSGEQRQENEQVVVEMGGQLDGDTWQHLTETSTTRRHLSGTSIAKMKPHGKLIMPTSNELFDFGSDPLPDQLQNKSKPSSQPLGRTESNSSCSSGSTDVFDDIFDTWTGAVSLFHRPAFGGDPTSSFGGQWRRLHRPKRTPSTGRCESTEPQIGRWAPRGSFKKRTEQTSGYESDAAAESSPARPASALAGAVGRFGSSNLLDSARLFQATPLQDSLETDDFFNDDLFSSQHQQSIAQQHLELRRRLAKQHKQPWKGSNPTLFDTSLDEERRWSERQRPRARLWQFLRPAETELDVEHSDSRVSRHQAEQTAIGGGLPRPPRPQQVQKQQQVASSSASEQQIDNQLNQSQSSSSFLRQSIALDASPRQRDTTGMQLPRCGIPRADSNSVQKSSSSASKASLITSKMADIQLGSTQITKQQQSFSSASFIQLKRTSSSSAWSVNKSQQQQQVEKSQKVQTCSSSTTSKLMSTSDESSSNFWDGRVSPMILEGGQSSRQMSAGQTPLEAADSRVQSWLQESSGNLSLSSASQSSTSDTVNSGTNLFGHSAVPKHLLPPVSPLASQLHSRAAEQTVLITSSSSSLKKSSTGDDPVAESTKMSKLVGRTTSGSSISKGSGNKQLTTTQTVVSRTLRSPVEVLEELALESEAQAANFDEMKKKRQIVEEQQVSARISPQLQQESGHKSPVLSRSQFATTASLLQKESQSDRLLSQLDELDSLSGGELESRSSSSLLDQLRSKGYRSMINQRMGGQLVNQQAQGELGAGSSNGSLVESSSRLVSMTTTTTTTVTTTSSGIQEESQTSSQMSDELTNLPISNIQHESEPVGSDEHKAVPGEATPRDSEESNVNEVILNTVNDQTVVEEEEDEDIREAKANIKTQLDRVKETELFLQSMHQEEENMERQRQQLFLFNNLMLSSKLGLNRTAPFRPGTSVVSGGSESGESYGMSSALSNIDGIRSAPVQSGLIGNGLALHQQPARESPPITNGSVPSGGSLALSFEPSYTPASLTRQHTPSNYGQLSLDYSGGDFQLRPTRDPLEPVQPLEVHHWNNHRAHNSALDNRPDWMQSRGRNKSQLSEQFADYNPYRRNSTKVSHLSDGIEPTLQASQNAFFPSRRSVSQLRYAPNRLSQPALGSQMMSEYRSAYGASSPIRQAKSPLPDRSSDDDDDMSAYRVSSYVPKVDLTTVERPSRSFQRRSYSELDSQVSSYSPTARSIHRDSITRARSPSYTNGRRRSCLDQSTCAQETPNSAPVQMEPNSRLSELEQRLQENKRRREELLFGSLSSSEAQPRSRRAESSEPAVAPTTGAVDQEHKPKATGVLSRPSRLESMEARIKRKSYCIRVEQDDQNEKQSQLRAMNERWRPSLSRLGSSRGSISESSTGGRTALRGSSCERGPGGSSRRATNGFTAEGESLPATSCNQMEV